MSFYRRLAYRTFRWTDSKPRPGILRILYKADIQMLPGMYLGTIFLTALIGLVVSLAGALIVFRYFIFTPLWPLITIGMVCAAVGMAAGSIPLITFNKITAKKVKIDATLPFLLAYMATLSSAGMNPVETIKHVALKDFGPVSREFQKIVYREEILGEDTVSAMNYIGTNTPSEELRDILAGITNIITSGGSLRSFCEQQSKSLFETKKARLKGFIDSLASFSEGYIGGIIVTIIMGIIGIVVIGALGLKVAFFSTQNLLDIFVFLVVPLTNVVFLAVLEMKFSSGEF